MEFIFQVLSQLLPSVEEEKNNTRQKAELTTEEAVEKKELAISDTKEEVAETNLFSMMEFH